MALPDANHYYCQSCYCMYMYMFIGDPFKFHYWLAQCAVYLTVMLIEKVIVGPLVFFDFWKKVSLIVCVQCGKPYCSATVALQTSQDFMGHLCMLVC